MPGWSELEVAAPALAAEVRRRLDAHVHKTLATLRRGGDPRISATETLLVDGELWLGSMPGARKALDLRRDPRFALHSGSDDPPAWDGDAKLVGRAEEVLDGARKAAVLGGDATPGSAHLFRLDLEEVSTVGLNERRDGLVIRVWSAADGLRTIERE